jgi:hypothetical protein
LINSYMDATNNIATDLFYKIRSRFKGLKLGDAAGTITINPEEARFFDFDYNEGDKNIGHVSISLAEANSMKVYFSNGITEGMDDSQKDNWYGFLKELRKFSKRRLLAFDTRDIAKDNLDQRDYAFLSQYSNPQADNDTIVKPVGENKMNESTLYGTKKQSFQKLEDTRLIIKHSKKLADDTEMKPGDRSRNIAALFVENQEGERFKYPFIHLAGARAMQRHVANGGAPYDAIGESIIKMSEEIAQLKSFTGYVVRNDLMNSDTNSVVERSKGQLDALRERIAKISKQAHYESYVESFQAPEAMEVPDDVMEQFKDQFTVRNFKEDLTSVFPVLYRLMKEDEIVGYDDIVEMTKTDSHDENGNGIHDTDEASDPFAAFENWAMALGEDSPLTAGSDEEIKEAVASLNELVSQDFPVGVDGTNAIQSLKGIIEDNRLFNDIKMKAKEDPNGDARPLVKAWVEEHAPEQLEALDFGDMVDEPAVSADQAEPQQEGFMPDEFEGEFEWEGVGDDGETTPCTVSYKASIENEDGPANIIVDPKSISLDCAMDGNSKLGFDADMDLEMQDMDELMAACQEDAQEMYDNADHKDHGSYEGTQQEGRVSDALIGAEEILGDFTDEDQKLTMPKDKVKAAIKVGKYEAADAMFAIDMVDTDFDDEGNHIEKQDEPDFGEGNKFSGAMDKAKKAGKKSFEVDGKSYDINEVAQFIVSMYDRNSGTFPKGPEGVATMVDKKFGEEAGMIARKMVERMAPAQEQGAEELEELERIKTLAGAY